MAKKFKSKGLVVIGVSDEDVDLIDKYVADKGVEYPIAHLSSDAFEKAIGVEGFPHSAILDPKGELAWSGHPASSDGPLGTHIKGSKRTELLPKALASVEKLLDKEDFSGAHGELKKLSEAGGLAQAETAAANGLLQYLEAQADRLWKKGAAALEAGDYYGASNAFTRLVGEYKGIGPAGDAAAKLDEFKKDAAVGEEIKAGAKLAEVDALKQAHDYDKAYKAYRSVAAKFKGTKAADRANGAADELKANGMLGFDANCSACQQAHKACERHAK